MIKALQVLYSIFLGLIVVSVIGLGVSTFYPEPGMRSDGTRPPGAYEHYVLVTVVVLMLLATVTMVLALVRPERYPSLSNGLLLGGLFTLLYSVVRSFDAPQTVARFVLMVVALIITVAAGWYRFERHRTTRPPQAPVSATASQDASPGGTDASASGGGTDATDLTARVAVLEARLDALKRALRD